MEISYRAGWISKILVIAQTMNNMCPDMQVARNGYAEPGYEALEGAPVILANWNCHARGEAKSDLTMPRLVDIFEHFGAEIEWCDEWAICECGKCVRTSPDSHGWKRYFWLNESAGEIICGDCVKESPEDYIDYLEGNENAALTLDIDLTEYSYEKQTSSYITGWHEWQDDNPRDAAKKLRDLGVNNFIFQIDDTEQFSVTWSVWVHEDETHRLEAKAA
jgi:hypothetical protein